MSCMRQDMFILYGAPSTTSFLDIVHLPIHYLGSPLNWCTLIFDLMRNLYTYVAYKTSFHLMNSGLLVFLIKPAVIAVSSLFLSLFALMNLLYELFITIDCHILSIPDHTAVNTFSVTYDTYVELTCDVGYAFDDSTTRRTIVCLQNGRWSAQLPVPKGRFI